jgi:hypothetical protein
MTVTLHVRRRWGRAFAAKQDEAMRGRLRATWGAALLLGVVTPASAAPGVVSAADIPSVIAGLKAAGHDAVIREDDEGVPYVLVDEGDDEFSVSFDDCDDAVAAIGCNLLIFNAAWEADATLDPDTVNQFNQQSTLAHAFLDEEGALNLSLSVTTKGGLPAANFAEVIAIWEASDKDLAEMIDAGEAPSSGVTVASLSAP